jgi:ribosomal protein S27E
MDCWHCGTQLIWGGDHDIEDETEEYIMETNLHCPKCRAEVIVYLPKDE